MLASQLIDSLKFKSVEPREFKDFEVKLLTQDTREVVPGSVFVAIKGFTVDGHKFVKQAIEKGAGMIIAQEKVDAGPVPVVYVNNTNRALAILSNCFYDSPSHKMKMIGVTGTNGKTTVTHMIEAICRGCGQQTGLIGTMYRRIGRKKYPTSNTTPDILTLQRTFEKMAAAKVDTVAMEVSSIALVQGRVWGIDFDIAVFTNFTQDHLDYHKTMANYAHAKSLLFSQLGNRYTPKGDPKVAVMNIDDPMGKKFQQDTAAQILTYGINEPAMIRASNVHVHERGTDFDLSVFGEKHHLRVKTVGLFNVYNLLAAFGAGYAAGISVDEMISVLEKFPGVKGRLQLLTSKSGVSAIVDYSHTPDGLLNALETINDFAKHDVYCVVGCGGDRDRSKRPKMAKIAVENCDHAIFTSDNPRTEDPEAILDEVVAGVPKGKKYERFVHRREAIQHAIMTAKPGDIVLIAGKGHEDYQIIGKTKHHFDDVEEAQKAFEMKEKAQAND